MIQEYVVPMPARATAAHLEQVMLAHYPSSLRAAAVTFDLRAMRWLGYFPASLLFSWAAELVSRKVRTRLELGALGDLPTQPRKILVDNGILAALAALGVTLVHPGAAMSSEGLPFLSIETTQDMLWTALAQQQRILQRSLGDELRTDVLRDAFSIVLYELLENSLIHGKARAPHYGVAFATSSGASRSAVETRDSGDARGMVDVFPAGTAYVELVCGDIGPGITATLVKQVPRDYAHVYAASANLTVAERTLLYAFEFSSTCDREQRRQRLERLMAQPAASGETASGLFCVLEVARIRRGQFVLRTPGAIIGFSFVNSHSHPVVTTKAQLGLRRLAPLKGTHYVLRLPLTPVPSQPRRRLSPLKIKPSARASTSYVLPFDSVDGTREPAVLLNHAISAVDRYIQKYRGRPGNIVMVGPLAPLPSRALSLFASAVHSMQAGLLKLFWLTPTPIEFLSRRHPEMPWEADVPNLSVGQPSENRYHSPDRREAFALPPELQGEVLRAYHDGLSEALSIALRHDSVRHSPGPFLIESQYYTDTFYEVAKALEAPYAPRAFAEWCMRKLLEVPSIIIVTTPVIVSIADELAIFIEQSTKVRPPVIRVFREDPWGATVARVLAYSDQPALVLADVICRGERLAQGLNQVTSPRLTQIIALVDARSGAEASDSFAWSAGGGRRRALPFAAVVREPVPPQQHLLRPASDEERLFVIDKTTHAPALYTRKSQPEISVAELLYGAARAAQALYYGHLVHLNKHYTHYLHFPRLFSELRAGISEWVRVQLDFVDAAEVHGPRQWNALVYNPDGSLTWLIPYLTTLPQGVTVGELTASELRAPRASSDRSTGAWLVVLPAIASGDTAKQALEYVSRLGPRQVLMLCVASRMDAAGATFYSGISEYRGCKTRIAYYLEFPPGAHAPGVASCSHCAEFANITRLVSLAKEVLADDSRPLIGALRAKAASLAPRSVEVLIGSESSRSAHVYERAFLASLYELSAFEVVDVRRMLNKRLQDPNAQELFLEVIGSERRAVAFRRTELEQRLYAALPAIELRARQLLENSAPPYAFGRVAAGIMHLLPRAFVDRAPELLRRYANSPRDTEELCIQLVQHGVEPSDLTRVIAESREVRSDALVDLLTDAHVLLSKVRSRDERSVDASVNAAITLWSTLARTSPFPDTLERLSSLVEWDDLDWPEVQGEISRLRREYYHHVPALVTDLERAPLWEMIGPAGLARDISELERALAMLVQLGLMPTVQSEVLDAVRRAVSALGTRHEAVVENLFALFVNPLMCESMEIPGALSSESNVPITVVKDFRVDVPLAFCAWRDLDFVVKAVVENWIVHGHEPRTGISATIRVWHDERYVIMDFSDNIIGDFVFASSGGLSSIRQRIEVYGGCLDVSERVRRREQGRDGAGCVRGGLRDAIT